MGWLKLQDIARCNSTHSWKVHRLSHDRGFPEPGAALKESRANCRQSGLPMMSHHGNPINSFYFWDFLGYEGYEPLDFDLALLACLEWHRHGARCHYWYRRHPRSEGAEGGVKSLTSPSQQRFNQQ